MWNEKEVHRLDTGHNMWPWPLTFDLTHDLDLGCFKVKFRNSSFSGIFGLIDVEWKRSELMWYWADCMTLPFDHTHDFDIGVEISRSESEIALSQECDSRLTLNEKDVSHPFITMILTSVTMLGWADVPDNDWGDFRRRRAVDISSLWGECANFITMDTKVMTSAEGMKETKAMGIELSHHSTKSRLENQSEPMYGNNKGKRPALAVKKTSCDAYIFIIWLQTCHSEKQTLQDYMQDMFGWYKLSQNWQKHWDTGPCITNVFATCRKNFSQWHRSFQRKLRTHWLKFLRHVAITLVIQDPDLPYSLKLSAPEGHGGCKQVKMTFKTSGHLHWKTFLHAVLNKEVVYEILAGNEWSFTVPGVKLCH